MGSSDPTVSTSAVLPLSVSDSLGRRQQLEHRTELQSRLDELRLGARVLDDSCTGEDVGPRALEQTAPQTDRELAVTAAVEPADTARVPAPVEALRPVDERLCGGARRTADGGGRVERINEVEDVRAAAAFCRRSASRGAAPSPSA